jgi:transcriptional regulator with XRE-family HTH domain
MARPEDDTSSEAPSRQRQALGSFLQGQRKLANLSLRELASLTNVSNAYLSQLERGLHEPSVRVLRSISGALGLSVTSVLAEAGLEDRAGAETAEAIAADPLLTPDQKAALLTVYRSYLSEAAGRNPERST